MPSPTAATSSLCGKAFAIVIPPGEPETERDRFCRVCASLRRSDRTVRTMAVTTREGAAAAREIRESNTFLTDVSCSPRTIGTEIQVIG